jgi:hypothetical protein
MARLPSGTVTLLFSDIEGSTRLLRGPQSVCATAHGRGGRRRAVTRT